MANVMSITVLILSSGDRFPAHARDTRHLLPIAVAMETKDAQDKLDGSVKFFFGDQPSAADPDEAWQRRSRIARPTPSVNPTRKPAIGPSFQHWWPSKSVRSNWAQCRHQHSQLLQQKSNVERDRVRVPRGGDHCRRGTKR